MATKPADCDGGNHRRLRAPRERRRVGILRADAELIADDEAHPEAEHEQAPGR